MLWEGNSAWSEGPRAQQGHLGQRNRVDDELYLYAGWTRKSIKTHLVFSLHDTVSQVNVCTCDWAYMHLCKNTWGSKKKEKKSTCLQVLVFPGFNLWSPALIGFESWHEYKWRFTLGQPCSHYQSMPTPIFSIWKGFELTIVSKCALQFK